MHVFTPRSNAARRLLCRIQQRYDTVTDVVQLGSTRFHFTRVADPNRVLDQVAEEEDRADKLAGVRRPGDSLHLPYWAELWDSALGIGQFLVDRRGRERKWLGTDTPAVLDLGCGMGFAGMIAAAMGYKVLMADLETPALLFAQLNSLGADRPARTRRLNWRTDRLTERFDLIIGADILYERAQWEFLEPFWRHHLNPTGAVLLGEPGRQTGELFVDWIPDRCWKLTEHRQQVSTRSKPIRLLELRPA